MQRKLVKQGQNALTVTLPANWLKEFQLKSGDVVDIAIHNDILRISPISFKQGNTITINFSKGPSHLLWQKIFGAYVAGYDEIIILQAPIDYVTHYIHYFFGMAIIELSEKRSIYKNMILQPDEKFEALFLRVKYLFLQMSTLLIQKPIATYELIKEHEKQLDTTIYFCLRYLHKYRNLSHDYQYFLSLATLEAAADNISKLHSNNPSHENLKNIHEVCTLYVKETNFDTMFTKIQTIRNSITKKTYTDGLTYAIIETLYNHIGYLQHSNK